jgi:hypothetical protein
VENNEQNNKDFLKNEDFSNGKLLEFRIYEFNLTAEECRQGSLDGIEKEKRKIYEEKCRFISYCQQVIRKVMSMGEYELLLDIQRTSLLNDFFSFDQYIDEVILTISSNGFTVRKEDQEKGGFYLYIGWKVGTN